MSYTEITDKIKGLAIKIAEYESDYRNIFYYAPRTDISDIDDKSEVQMGPPSMYENYEDDKSKRDMRRQGPAPAKDVWYQDREISLVDGPGGYPPFENLQGKPTKNPDRGPTENYDDEDLQKDTIGFEPDADRFINI